MTFPVNGRPAYDCIRFVLRDICSKRRKRSNEGIICCKVLILFFAFYRSQLLDGIAAEMSDNRKQMQNCKSRCIQILRWFLTGLWCFPRYICCDAIKTPLMYNVDKRSWNYFEISAHWVFLLGTYSPNTLCVLQKFIKNSRLLVCQNP